MTSLPQLTIHSDCATLNLSFTGVLAINDEYGAPETHHAHALASRLTKDIRSLCVFLGPNLGPYDDLALSPIMENIATGCLRLEFLSISGYANIWNLNMTTRMFATLPPSVLRTMRFVDPDRKSEVTMTTKDGQEFLSASLSLKCLEEESFLAVLFLSVWRLTKLVIMPPLIGADYVRDIILTSFNHFLPRLRDLVHLSLPLDLSLDLVRILFLASALPHCNELTLVSSPMRLHPPFVSFSRLALVEGLHKFHHLKVLCLPIEVLCKRLHACLRELEDLQELTVIINTACGAPHRLATPRPGQFSQLRTLRIKGSFTHTRWALHAFAHPAANFLRRLCVESKFIQNKQEVGMVFNVMKDHCPVVEEVGIYIEGVGASARADWVDLSPLRDFTLKKFDIQHPRPLVLSDGDILSFLVEWPKAKHVSLNLRPTLLPWASIRGGATQAPTLNCLVHVADHGHKLHHLGVHANLRFAHSLKQDLFLAPNRFELDLGSRCNKRDLAVVRGLFPQITLL